MLQNAPNAQQTLTGGQDTNTTYKKRDWPDKLLVVNYVKFHVTILKHNDCVKRSSIKENTNSKKEMWSALELYQPISWMFPNGRFLLLISQLLKMFAVMETNIILTEIFKLWNKKKQK